MAGMSRVTHRTLYHVSEEPAIERFIPRPSPRNDAAERDAVWAIEDRLMHNYLLPRDCPRVTFYARDDSDPADVQRLMGETAAAYVVAIESAWYERARDAALYLYRLPAEAFERPIDDGAGYYVSYEAVEPVEVIRADRPLEMMIERGVELRITPSLWPLSDAVIASSLQFSNIRMRNAQPRESPAEGNGLTHRSRAGT